MRSIVIAAFVLSFILLSCKKSGSPAPAPTPPPSGSGDVYTVGFESNGTVTVAKYWKNKVAVSLTDGTKNAQALGICISGTDVYICGFEQNAAGKYVAKYWKNGTAVVLGDGTNSSIANAIAVSGNDVFVVGIEITSFYPKLPIEWVNGTRYAAQLGPGIINSENTAVSVKNGVFYVAGTVFVPVIPSGNYYAQRWSHTLPFTYVAPTSITIDGYAYGIVSDGTDMYTCGAALPGPPGNFYTAAYYWKNNIPHKLTDGTKYGSATGITLSGTDVYVCGYDTKAPSSSIGIASYWKNGVLTALGNGSLSTFARGIAVKNSDVYVCGNDVVPGGNNGYLWKNGVLYDSTKSANAVFFGVAVSQ